MKNLEKAYDINMKWVMNKKHPYINLYLELAMFLSLTKIKKKSFTPIYVYNDIQFIFVTLDDCVVGSTPVIKNREKTFRWQASGSNSCAIPLDDGACIVIENIIQLS